MRFSLRILAYVLPALAFLYVPATQAQCQVHANTGRSAGALSTVDRRDGIVRGASSVLSLSTTFKAPDSEWRAHFGGAVAGVGDVNGDGTGDVVVTAPSATVDDRDAAGRAYLMSGADGNVLHSIETPNPNEDGTFGGSVAAVEDLDGDGTNEVIVGAPGETVDGTDGAGRAYLISGANGSIVRVIPSSNPDQTGGFGASVATVGDVNGDGTKDVFVGAPGETVNGNRAAGRGYVLTNLADGNGTSRSTLALPAPNPRPRGTFGASSAGPGDVDGDGAADLLIGAPFASVEGTKYAGRAYVMSGSDGQVIHKITPDEPLAEGLFGRSLAGVGDVSGDGRPDLLVGAQRHKSNGDKGGKAYLVGGADGQVLRTFTSEQPEDNASAIKTYAVAGAGDLNGDGTLDVAIGVRQATVGDKESAGRVHLVSGVDGRVLQTLTSPNAEGASATNKGPNKGGNFGGTVARIGDVDGDGTPDLLIGAENERVGEQQSAGRAYLYTTGSAEK